MATDVFCPTDGRVHGAAPARRRGSQREGRGAGNGRWVVGAANAGRGASGPQHRAAPLRALRSLWRSNRCRVMEAGEGVLATKDAKNAKRARLWVGGEAPWAMDRGVFSRAGRGAGNGPGVRGRPMREGGPRGRSVEQGPSRSDSVGSVVLARSASANPSSFARYGPRIGPRLAHSSACRSICFAITSLPTESIRLCGLCDLCGDPTGVA